MAGEKLKGAAASRQNRIARKTEPLLKKKNPWRIIISWKIIILWHEPAMRSTQIDNQQGGSKMILDGHIHMFGGPIDGDRLIKEMNEAGVDGGIIISLPPRHESSPGAKERLDKLFQICRGKDTLYPFFWIDPVEDSAPEQVSMALEYGVKGFKVICSHHYPGDERAMKVYQAIADAGKPILFHSGILWDGKFSSKYNRPAEFEALLEIRNLKFALAHVSWPWCDECIAVYGKFLNAYSLRRDVTCEMFIDITPGTPPIYREEVLTKLFTVGYSIEDNIIYGTDCNTARYNRDWVREWTGRDNAIYNKLGLGSNVLDKIYSKNLMRFLGLIDANVDKKTLKPGEN